jgi:peptidyl-prolyl cis-trans isomerase A (cyclophilin A)
MPRPSLLAAFLLVAACGSGPTTPITPVAGAASGTTSTPADGTARAPIAAIPAVHHAPAELDPARATERAPEVFSVRFTTTQGDFIVEVHRSWAPLGADRFFNLARIGFYDDTRFFRVVEGFMVQFGLPGDPAVAAKWNGATIPDDPVTQSNLRGYVTFAMAGPNSRTTQIFIDFNNHPRLDQSGFAPFGKVIQGMEVVDALYKGYGEGAPSGKGPSQERIQTEGNAYLDSQFPKLDRVLKTEVLR